MDLQALIARYRDAGAYVEREGGQGVLLAAGGVDLEDGAELASQPARGALASLEPAPKTRLDELRAMAAALAVPAVTLEADAFADRMLTFTASDESVDRYGSRILVDGTWEGKKHGKGWNLKAFGKNPVFMPFHSYSTVPLGLAVDTWTDEKGGRKRLRQTVLMDDGQANPAAPFILAAYKSRLMRAVSVGFWPNKVVEPDDEERERWKLGRFGVLYAEQELWEVSAVAIPANPAALVEGLDFERGDELEGLAVSVAPVYPDLAYQIRDVRKSLAPAVAVAAPPAPDPQPALDKGPAPVTLSAFEPLARAALDRFGGLCDRLENLIVEFEGSAIGARVAPSGPAPPAPKPTAGSASYGELLNILEETRSALRGANAPANPAS